MANRPQPPLPVRRQLRTEAHFGCCNCGFPFLEYHHIVPWAQDEHFRPEDMIALCSRCHDAAGKGVLTQSEQYWLKAHPFNAREGRAKGNIYIRQDYIAADIGAGVFLVGDGIDLKFNEQPFLAMKRTGIDTLSLSADIYSDEGERLLYIDDNDWLSHRDLPWDIESDWQKLRVRQEMRQIRFEIDGSRIPMRLRGHWNFGGFEVVFGDSICSIGGLRFKDLGLVSVDFILNKEEIKLSPRDGGCIVSQAGARERLYRCRRIVYANRLRDCRVD